MIASANDGVSAAWHLRYAGTKLALASSGTSGHSATLAVESEQSL
jgi:hypothetical protein